jgi:hypothetical protein
MIPIQPTQFQPVAGHTKPSANAISASPTMTRTMRSMVPTLILAQFALPMHTA